MLLRTHFQVDFLHIDDTGEEDTPRVSTTRQLSVIPCRNDLVHFGDAKGYIVDSVQWDFSRMEYPIILIELRDQV